MRKLVVDYGQASITINNVNSSLEYLNEELRQIKNAISEIEALNVRYSKTNTILDELYEQKKKAEDAEVILWSMDDENVYGKEFYKLTFGKAVENNLLTDYKVIILSVSQSYVHKYFQNNILCH